MERFVKLVAAGGLTLVVGRWTVRFTAALGDLVRRTRARTPVTGCPRGSVSVGSCHSIGGHDVTVTPTVLPAALFRARMDEDAVAELIEEALPEAQATVTTPRDPDDDKHYAVRVVSPAFEGESLVDQHQLVHDALGEHLTRDIHAIELTTLTPEEAE
jgi:stress-induced morphogen